MRSLRIIIMAKAPQAGKAKTRLISALGAQGAAELAGHMLAHTARQALAAAVGAVELCVSPAPGDLAWRSLEPMLGGTLAWSDQGEGDLGMRMARAARRGCAGGDAVMLIGTDCPALDATALRRAAAALLETDATLVPTFDGGYALLGMKRFHPSLFEDIAWSTDSVAFDTQCRLSALGWSVRTHPVVHDIDEPADLCHLPSLWRAALRGERAHGMPAP
ncbi:MAG: TIGR04282 family arsenosugar biosynthesis glycosyltransferase [Pseudomonadota bacterium]